MRLRRKPWIDEAIKDYTDILYLEEPTDRKGEWRSVFPHPEMSSMWNLAPERASLSPAWHPFTPM